jgi:hypothetical protein
MVRQAFLRSLSLVLLPDNVVVPHMYSAQKGHFFVLYRHTETQRGQGVEQDII